uniref:Uncharacterized protein n=1 Tax=Spongospora subterranea TaxID=70186 RepID=A0A0H5QNK4_9EUKA|eukprot:CRZ03578.1 hypothetical protein [Spongospora subterranea]
MDFKLFSSDSDITMKAIRSIAETRQCRLQGASSIGSKPLVDELYRNFTINNRDFQPDQRRNFQRRLTLQLGFATVVEFERVKTREVYDLRRKQKRVEREVGLLLLLTYASSEKIEFENLSELR